jgi:glycerol uptake facilitator-like aquaporin
MSARALVAEGLGTCMLVCAVVGSGIMADRLTGDAGLALLANTAATAAALFVLITVFAPVSGAHFNPVVTLAFALRGDLHPRLALAYLAAQLIGGALGSVLAHAMFDLPLVQISQTLRSGPGQWLAEALASFVLLLAILGAVQARANIAAVVACTIASAYWFTASTSFANPAVTLARAISDTFAGIHPAHTPAFIAAQILGGLLGLRVASWLFASKAGQSGAIAQ